MWAPEELVVTEDVQVVRATARLKMIALEALEAMVEAKSNRFPDKNRFERRSPFTVNCITQETRAGRGRPRSLRLIGNPLRVR